MMPEEVIEQVNVTDRTGASMDPPPGGSDSETQENESRTFHQEVKCNGTKVLVTVTKEGQVIEKWIEGQTNETMFGLGVEWKPNQKKGQDNKIALLQISSSTECLLVQMLYLDYIPDPLRKFLRDPARSIAGVGIAEDARKLARDHGLGCEGLAELNALRVPGMRNSEKFSLKSLARLVLYFDMNKSREITLSNWAEPHLSSRQVEYACLDAWTARSVHSELSGLSTSDGLVAYAPEEPRFCGFKRRDCDGSRPSYYTDGGSQPGKKKKYS